MKRIALAAVVAVVALMSIGCFGNTLVMTAGGYGVGLHLNPTNLTVAMGRFDFNIVDSDLYQEQLKVTFSQDGTSSLANLFNLDTGIFTDGKQDTALAYKSYMELELKPLFAPTQEVKEEEQLE